MHLRADSACQVVAETRQLTQQHRPRFRTAICVSQRRDYDITWKDLSHKGSRQKFAARGIVRFIGPVSRFKQSARGCNPIRMLSHQGRLADIHRHNAATRHGQGLAQHQVCRVFNTGGCLHMGKLRAPHILRKPIQHWNKKARSSRAHFVSVVTFCSRRFPSGPSPRGSQPLPPPPSTCNTPA
jgi:hypothetical protein